MKRQHFYFLFLLVYIGSWQPAAAQALPDSIWQKIADTRLNARERVDLARQLPKYGLAPTLAFADSLQGLLTLQEDTSAFIHLMQFRASVYDVVSTKEADRIFDQLKQYSNDLILPPKIKMSGLYTRVRRVHLRGYYRQLDSLATLGVAMAEELLDTNYQVMFHNYRGLAAQSIGQYENGISAFKRCQMLAHEAGDQEGVLLALQNISATYDLSGDYVRALNTNFEAEAVIEKYALTYHLGSIVNNRATIYKVLGNDSLALRTYKYSAEIYRAATDNLRLTRTWANIATVLSDQSERINEALAYSDSALTMLHRTKLGGEYDLYTQYQIRAGLLVKYKDWNTARVYSDSALMVQEAVGFEAKPTAQIQRLQILAKEENSRRALAYLEKVNINPNRLERVIRPNYYETVAKIQAAEGNHVAAYENIDLAYELLDSLQNEETQERIARAEEAEAVQIREVALARSEAELTVAEASVRNRTYIGGLIGLLALLGIFGWWTNRKRLREKEILNTRLAGVNTELEASSTKIRTLNRLINHRAAGQIGTAIGIINAQITELEQADEDPRIRELLDVSKGRLQALGVVNKQLSGRSAGEVDVASTIRELVAAMQDSSGVRYKADLDLTPVSLPAETASYCALILNELITNSVKYAFGTTAAPRLTVRARADAETLHLDYRDNGPGKDDRVRGTGHGSGLLRELIQQLYGRAEERNDGGYHFQLQIPLDHAT